MERQSKKNVASPLRASGSKAASVTIRLLVLLVPAIAGFIIAYAILGAVGPFDSGTEQVTWFILALLISLATSVFVADFVRTAIRGSSLYQKANSFDTDVEALFGSALRDGSAKSMKRQAVKLGQDADVVNDVLTLLDQLLRHDRLTRGHSERVRAYSSLIGKQIGLSPRELEELNWSAMLHDIGKLDVPNSVLNSPDRPTDDEWAVLRRHPESARYRLRHLEKALGETIFHGAEHHHERFDGTGYPKGLSGTDIPLYGRITAIADAFDVMTHARSYKKPMTIAEAREELLRSSETHFDPALIAAFIEIGDDELKDVRGWSATFAGLALSGSRIAALGTQSAVVVTSVAGVAVGSVSSSPEPPPIIAFEEVLETTTTTTAAPTTTTAAPTTTTTSTTTTTAPTTTTQARRFATLNYNVGSNIVDGVEVSIDVDELKVFLNDEPHEVFELDSERMMSVVFDITDLEPGPHRVRFELYREGQLLSVDEAPLFA